MVTGQPCTVYNCGTCGAPAYYNPAHGKWWHFGRVTTCGEVSPLPVTLPAPARVS